MTEEERRAFARHVCGKRITGMRFDGDTTEQHK
jgi:hypothetical protein